MDFEKYLVKLKMGSFIFDIYESVIKQFDLFYPKYTFYDENTVLKCSDNVQ